MDRAAVLVSAARGQDSCRPNRLSGDEQAFGVAYIILSSPRRIGRRMTYEFYAPVRDVEQFEIDSIPISKFRSTVMRVHDGRADIDMDIHATREAMRETAVPMQGDEIAGALWLQGILLPG